MPTDDTAILIETIAGRLSETWRKLTASDIAHYKDGRRAVFLTILERKYILTRMALSAVSNSRLADCGGP